MTPSLRVVFHLFLVLVTCEYYNGHKILIACGTKTNLTPVVQSCAQSYAMRHVPIDFTDRQATLAK
jgi:hypothetical protein